LYTVGNQVLIFTLIKDLFVHKQWGLGLKQTSVHIGNRSVHTLPVLKGHSHEHDIEIITLNDRLGPN
jgi:hypothetical protein